MLQLKRVVTNISFEDPYVCKFRLEKTYYNPVGTSPVNRIQFITVERGYFSNLQIFDSQNRRLEIYPSDLSSSRKWIEIKPASDIVAGEIYSVFAEYVLSEGDKRSKKRGLLIEQIGFDFTIELGNFSTYFTITPPPRIEIALDKKASVIPSDRSLCRMLDQPPKRNAVSVRFSQVSKDNITLFIQDRLKRDNIQASVSFDETQGFSVAYSNTVIGRLRKILPFPLRVVLLLLPFSSFTKELIYARAKVEDEKNNRIIENVIQESALRPTARISVFFKLRAPIRYWFLFVTIYSIIVGFFAANVAVIGSGIALLAVTRSWLFYEERMMRMAGLVFVGLLFINAVGMVTAFHFQHSIIHQLTGVNTTTLLNDIVKVLKSFLHLS